MPVAKRDRSASRETLNCPKRQLRSATSRIEATDPLPPLDRVSTGQQADSLRRIRDPSSASAHLPSRRNDSLPKSI